MARCESGVPISDRGGHVGANRLDTAFVGRIAEMDDLVSAVEDALAGQGRAVFVGGEPGIGKTSLGRRVAAYAQTRGMSVLWGRCHEDDVEPPYWPWIELLRAGVLDLAQEPLIAVLLGPTTNDVTDPATPWDRSLAPRTPDEDRVLVFDRFTARLRDVASRGPLLLVFDDLHSADRSSLSLLRFLFQRIADTPIMVLALYRDIELGRRHALTHLLAEAAREAVVRRYSLRGLATEEVARFLEIGSGSQPPRALVETVWRQTAGNPFFVKELVRLLLSDGDLVARASTGSLLLIPQTVREAIGQRLDRLSSDCNRVLSLAAVIGREFGVGVLERLAQAPREHVLHLLEEGIVAGLLAEAAPATGRYVFSHVLFRDTLYAELPTTERIALHRQIGEILEALHGPHLDLHLPELAFHFTQAARGGDAAKAVTYSLRAGHRAAAATAFEESVRCYESALESLDLAPVADQTTRCEVLLLLSEALWRTGSFQRARTTARHAFDAGRALGSVRHVGRAALAVAGRMASFGAGQCDQEVVDVLTEALQAMGDGEESLRALVTARLAQELNFSAAADRVTALAADAVAQAECLQDTAVLASVLRNTYWPLWGARTAAERLVVATTIVALADHEGDAAMAFEGHVFTFIAHVELGDRAAALRELETCTRSAERLRQPYLRWIAATTRACWASGEGPFEDVERASQEALAHGQEDQNQAALLFFGTQYGYLAWLRGRFDDVEQTLLSNASWFPLLMETVRAALAVTYAAAGRLDEARIEFEHFAARDFADLRNDVTWGVGTTQLAHVCAILGDADRAPALYRRLLPSAGLNAVVVPTNCLGSVDRYLGELAATMQRWDDATRHFDTALAMNRRMHAWPQLALTALEYARMLGMLGDRAAQSQIASLLEESIAIADRLGMSDVSRKARALASEQPSLAAATGHLPDAANTPASVAPGTEDCVFRSEGEFWTVAHNSQVMRLKHRKGFTYLAELLRRPGLEFAAYDLATGAPCGRQRPFHPGSSPASRPGGSSTVGPMLDRTAREQYRRHHADLEEQRAEAERMNDPLRAARLREEADLLAEHLGAALGIGGRPRRNGSAAERSRSTVTKGIRGAIHAIRRSNPALGRYLATNVRTGYLCVYAPDPEHPIRFTL